MAIAWETQTQLIPGLGAQCIDYIIGSLWTCSHCAYYSLVTSQITAHALHNYNFLTHQVYLPQTILCTLYYAQRTHAMHLGKKKQSDVKHTTCIH